MLGQKRIVDFSKNTTDLKHLIESLFVPTLLTEKTVTQLETQNSSSHAHQQIRVAYSSFHEKRAM